MFLNFRFDDQTFQISNNKYEKKIITNQTQNLIIYYKSKTYLNFY